MRIPPIVIAVSAHRDRAMDRSEATLRIGAKRRSRSGASLAIPIGARAPEVQVVKRATGHRGPPQHHAGSHPRDDTDPGQSIGKRSGVSRRANLPGAERGPAADWSSRVAEDARARRARRIDGDSTRIRDVRGHGRSSPVGPGGRARRWRSGRSRYATALRRSTVLNARARSSAQGRYVPRLVVCSGSSGASAFSGVAFSGAMRDRQGLAGASTPA